MIAVTGNSLIDILILIFVVALLVFLIVTVVRKI